MSLYVFIYILYIIICFSVNLLCSYVKIKRSEIIILLFILITINSIIAAFRPVTSADTYAYIEAYQASRDVISNLEIYGIQQLFFNRSYKSIEIGFIYFMAFNRYFFSSTRLFFFFISLIISLLSVKGIYLCSISWDKYNLQDNKSSSLNLLTIWNTYLFWGGVHYTSVAIRSGLAIALGLCFIGLVLSRRRYVVAFVCLILAILVHSTAITYIPILLLLLYGPKKLDKKYIGIIWGMLGIGYIIGIGNYTVNSFLKFIKLMFGFLGINAFGSYFENIEFVFQKREFILILILGILLLMVYFNVRTVSRMSLIVLAGIALSTFAYPIHALSREVDIFTIFIIPIVCYAEIILSKKRFIYVKLMTLFLFIPQYVMIFSRF